MKRLLKKMCLAFGPSGCEHRVREIVKSEIKQNMPRESELLTDNLGGIYLHIKNEGAPRLMICAHMDEVGFMVTQITEGGMLKFGCVGGIDPLVLSAKQVISERGVLGTISSKPIHLLDSEQRARRTEVKDMYINIGASNRAQAEQMVSIGDYFTFDSAFVELGDGLIKSKALDDRHGCTTMLHLIKELAQGIGSRFDLYFAFTTREEVSYSGASCLLEQIRPDYAIVIESKAVLDLPNVSDEKCVGRVGDGALISYADRGAIMDRALTDELISVCEREKIKYQINKAVSGGNDTGTIQRGAYGSRVALVSAPSRYIHSGAGVISYSDFEAIGQALLAFIRR